MSANAGANLYWYPEAPLSPTRRVGSIYADRLPLVPPPLVQSPIPIMMRTFEQQLHSQPFTDTSSTHSSESWHPSHISWSATDVESPFDRPTTSSTRLSAEPEPEPEAEPETEAEAVAVAEDRQHPFIMEFSKRKSRSSASQTPEIKAPLRTSHISKNMRSMMSVFRLNPFSAKRDQSSPVVDQDLTWLGEKIGPLDEEPRLIEFQVHLQISELDAAKYEIDNSENLPVPEPHGQQLKPRATTVEKDRFDPKEIQRLYSSVLNGVPLSSCKPLDTVLLVSMNGVAAGVNSQDQAVSERTIKQSDAVASSSGGVVVENDQDGHQQGMNIPLARRRACSLRNSTEYSQGPRGQLGRIRLPSSHLRVAPRKSSKAKQPYPSEPKRWSTRRSSTAFSSSESLYSQLEHVSEFLPR